MAVVMVSAMLLALLLDLVVNRSDFGSFGMNATEARHFNSLLSRNLNQLLAVIFTAVAIAVALTANAYSVKFLEFFIKDKVNALALALVVFADLNNSWIGFSLRDEFVPGVQMGLSLVLTTLCFALVFPYLYYVFRFLHPVSLLERLEQEFDAACINASKYPQRTKQYQRQLADSIEHVANIAVHAVTRDDKNTAITAVQMLERTTRSYWSTRKTTLPDAWFTADSELFLSFSKHAVERFNESRSWVEMKAFSQIQHVFGAAVPAQPEVSSAVARSMRALAGQARHDAPSVRLLVQYINSFLRVSLNRKDVRSLFTLLDQYRDIAQSLIQEQPDLVREMAYYIEYYGGVARESGLPFVTELAAHDLGSLVRAVCDARAGNQDVLVRQMLEFDGGPARALPGVRRALAILGGYFLTSGHYPEAALVENALAQLDKDALRSLSKELLAVRDENYWEITDRRVNIDYVPDDQRAQLQQLIERAEAATRP